MQESAADDQKTLKIGILQKDKNEGPMVDEWNSFFSKQSLSYELIDAASSIAQLLAIKDTEELVHIFVIMIFLLYTFSFRNLSILPQNHPRYL